MEKERPDITLEKATIDDAEAYIALEKSLGETKTYATITEKDEAIEEINKNNIFFIKNEGEVVGHIAYEMKESGHAYISSLVITPKYQGRGLAKQALRQVLEKLKDIEKIDLITHPENIKALAIYKSFGFQMGDRIENYFGDGEPRIKLALIKK
ncbi:MAG: hypothetical protein QG665_529 [Patescibacteria group bacterium]|nr:hypothetical protein [Patescibacteria group bacterium]